MIQTLSLGYVLPDSGARGGDARYSDCMCLLCMQAGSRLGEILVFDKMPDIIHLCVHGASFRKGFFTKDWYC